MFRSISICLFVGLAIFELGLSKIPPSPTSKTPLTFQTGPAYQAMKDLSKQFPDRVTWSDQRRAASEWLKGQFKNMGYTPQGMLFSETIDGKHYTDLENIYVEKRGTKKPEEVILLLAHYDVAEMTHEGAMDDASGVGVVLELARIFATQETERSVVFLLTDSEEFGSFWGARAFARTYEFRNQIIAALSLDFLAPGDQTKILTLCDGLKTGFSPLWLRELSINSIRSTGGTPADMNAFVEFVQRALQVPAADQGALLAAGIPAVNWVGQTEDFSYVMSHFHHTPNDVAEAMRPQSLESAGKAAERMLRTLDQMPEVPSGFRNSSYWKISDKHYLSGWATNLLCALAFVPFLISMAARIRSTIRGYSREELKAEIRTEGKSLGILTGALLLGYGTILMLPSLKVITQYEVFPATQKSLLLYSPNIVAILVVIAAIFFVYFALHAVFPIKTRQSGQRQISPEVRHAFQNALLGLIIAAAFAKNPHGTVLFLIPPAYFWSALRNYDRIQGRVLNLALLGCGAITLVAAAAVMTTIFHVGVPYWYLFLSASYGLIPAHTMVLFVMALAVMIRLFRLFVIKCR